MNETAASEPSVNPYEAVLRLCGAAAPGPWYPRLHVNGDKEGLAAFDYYLEQLWLEGLVRPVRGTRETGTGFDLTPQGRRVLASPEALRRLREGRPVFAGERGPVVRSGLRRPLRPRVTKLLLWANLALFAYCAYLADAARITRLFLSYVPGQPTNQGLVLAQVLHQAGGVGPADILRGQWWRLLSAAFVHLGLLHLGCNMLGLWMAGRAVEQMFGPVRYLVIYLVSALAGSCLGIAYNVQPTVGASGALCGVLGAATAWLVLNRGHLPRSMVRRAGWGLVSTFVLLIVFSSMPGVSGWAHFGGLLAGAAVGLLLDFQRFGPSPWRWLAPLGLVPLAWLGVFLLQRSEARDPRWEKVRFQVEEEDFKTRYATRINDTRADADNFYDKRVLPLVKKHPDRRDPEEVKKVLSGLAERQKDLAELAASLAGAGPYRDPRLGQRLQEERKEVRARGRLLARAGKFLRAGKKWLTPEQAEEAEARDFEKRYLTRVNQAGGGAVVIYNDRIQPLLETQPPKRDAMAVGKAVAQLSQERRGLTALAEELGKAAPYEDSDRAEKARKQAREYLTAAAHLFEAAQRCLRAGPGWTEDDQKGLLQRRDKANEERAAWRKLLELPRGARKSGFR